MRRDPLAKVPVLDLGPEHDSIQPGSGVAADRRRARAQRLVKGDRGHVLRRRDRLHRASSTPGSPADETPVQSARQTQPPVRGPHRDDVHVGVGDWRASGKEAEEARNDSPLGTVAHKSTIAEFMDEKRVMKERNERIPCSPVPNASSDETISSKSCLVACRTQRSPGTRPRIYRARTIRARPVMRPGAWGGAAARRYRADIMGLVVDRLRTCPEHGADARPADASERRSSSGSPAKYVVRPLPARPRPDTPPRQARQAGTDDDRHTALRTALARPRVSAVDSARTGGDGACADHVPLNSGAQRDRNRKKSDLDTLDNRDLARAGNARTCASPGARARASGLLPRT